MRANVENEVWRPVMSEPGVLASNLGRILLPPRFAPMSNGGYRLYTPIPRFGQVAKANKDAKHVYMNMMVYRTGQSRQSPRKVHQLVCEAFHGPRPSDDHVVIHENENALDNRSKNLRWGTQKDNLNMPKMKAYQMSGAGGKREYVANDLPEIWQQ